MKVSYVLTLVAGGFITSGYHTMNDPQTASFFMFFGIGALIFAAVASEYDK